MAQEPLSAGIGQSAAPGLQREERKSLGSLRSPDVHEVHVAGGVASPRAVDPETVCNYHRVEMRELSPDDAVWAAELMDRRRQEYERYSPVFWRPAQDAVGPHAQFLASQILADTNIALRTGRGFIICQRRPAEGLVDDFAVEHAGVWDDDGAALLLAAAERLRAVGQVTAIRVVTAHADQPKVNMLRGLSLRLAEQWWVRELQPESARTTAPGRVTGPGFSGIFGPAPPVYDPGGPVLLADCVADDTEIAVVEREATALGAVIAIIPESPGTVRASKLPQHGWSVASDWYLGWPLAAAG